MGRGSRRYVASWLAPRYVWWERSTPTVMLLRVSNWKSKDGVGFVSPYECMDSFLKG